MRPNTPQRNSASSLYLVIALLVCSFSISVKGPSRQGIPLRIISSDDRHFVMRISAFSSEMSAIPEATLRCQARSPSKLPNKTPFTNMSGTLNQSVPTQSRVSPASAHPD
ncbi:hypothetical protein V8E53_012981 [Lactarius tabidus]